MKPSRRLQNGLRITIWKENFNELKAINYPSLTIPKAYGGAGISLSEMLRYQEAISRADGSTGLSIGWHMGIVQDLGETNKWDESVLEALFDDIQARGALINNCATEKQTGSPTRGGNRLQKPEEKAGLGSSMGESHLRQWRRYWIISM